MRALLVPLLLLPLATAALDSWRDERGVIHIQGGAPPEPVVEPATVPATALAEGVVEAVPDGDTVHLKGGMKLRLIGINAPEVAHHNRPGEPGGEAAKRFLREQLMGRRVRLEHDLEARDRYGRELVHLRDESGSLVNEWLLREGHAWVSLYPPNLGHLERYLAAEAEARAAGRGVWARPRYGVIGAGEAIDFRNSFRRLRGRVTEVGWRGGEARLLLDGAVALRMDREAVARFRAAGIDPQRLHGRRLVVRGRLGGRGDLPSMRLRHPFQIEESQ